MDNPKLTRCKDCKENVSINASSCPHCGAKLKNSSIDHFMAFIVAVIIVALIYFLI